jgi:hypothetical protein
MLPAFFCFSLVSETIPCHRGYGAFPQSKKDYLRKVICPFSSSFSEQDFLVSKPGIYIDFGFLF